ncbi:MAG: CDP-glucose 4,6-dehydratase [Verrucomicrobiales bacterium]|nr:CDP-glucose 4,6-dehydratase [Verrucomicrobiota bacterium JB025]
MNVDFWKNKRVFLTGHTGFKGSWMSLWLQQMGAEVTGYSLAPNTEPALFEVAGIGNGMESVIADIRDLDAMVAAVREARPEIVIHMAAQPLVRESYAEPVTTYATNVMGTVHLLEAVRQTAGVKAVVVVTSDKCYENEEWHWAYREESRLGGADPYSNSKACSELVTASYRTSFFHPEKFADHGVAVASARAGNVIGGGDWAKDRLVPDAIAALEAGCPLALRNPHATRPWQHVLEPLNGYLVLAEALFTDGPKHADAWNFGPYEFSDRTVGWIVDRLCELWGFAVAKEKQGGPQLHEAGYLKVDSSRARALLGWAPKLDLDTTLQWIVDWSKARADGSDMRETTVAQIREFMALPAYQPRSATSS